MAPIIVNFDTQANLDPLYMFTLKKTLLSNIVWFFLSRIVDSGLFYLGVFNLNPILFVKINFVYIFQILKGFLFTKMFLVTCFELPCWVNPNNRLKRKSQKQRVMRGGGGGGRKVEFDSIESQDQNFFDKIESLHTFDLVKN